ncbi:MFS transporter [Mesorhizobium sp. M2D.F.Ca.ET.185.01.1.1]|uniref:MFS transporter n=1 Tax=unclassified Mesorhizobium TaxID=325217 RepID=UPI000FCB23EE|nr:MULTISPECIES: MFS transporter [unclassified Mesorhizobium]TGP48339.1 MFS transporter [bacterium M00.F.Ca.ET.230.01.1.1]TGP74389.1 MFS transporter [bacterium M00.F.Ca.ET.227.01.1.1]TGP85075.1 MFS transporter [bacterium M00.F.Ca.ET.221.01.1.1]TGP89158.1 MFS transporter [bacterium M00.F.Ca.ET.222.01.1.1]TGU12769.1 MFS transporter [bacterium M00.F.Ca.ET.163.01.1.1]TGU21313.1 MFS transporter [bacterium M00.F.Ca.ET.156.01.1.1]TGU43724.1 MFS transporter [bacterium M00.F.Ca.ET.146.01.1.1]TGV6698
MTTSEHTELMGLRRVAADSWRFGLIALIAFLTLVDLFATQAILPSLVVKFGVSRATMGFAVNASTFGMAVAGIAVALFGRGIDRRNGIWISLAILAIPTTLLSQTDNIVVFAVLRVAQGLCMSTAFTLTMAYLAEHFSARQTTSALAAYVTGNVASNFFGRLMSAAVADMFGISTNFLTFAALNLLGAALVWFTLQKTSAMMHDAEGLPARSAWKVPLQNVELRACFAIGFLILFVFIGTFTYVNFQLVAVPLSLTPMALGVVYFVFLPSMLTTPLAGRVASGLGPRMGVGATLGLAIVGLLLLLAPSLPIVLAGMALVASGTFLAQAIATGHVSRAASRDRAAASGIYLASYYAGGLAGSFLIGQIYDRVGWTACVAALVAVLAVAIAAARTLRTPAA